MYHFGEHRPDIFHTTLMGEKKKEEKAGASGRKAVRHPVEKSANLMQMIMELSERKFTGFIKINFSSGSVGKIEKFEEILKK